MSSGQVTYLYVTGASFCGSTLFAFLLNTHPKIVSVGEVGGPNRAKKETYPCSCGVPLSDCKFYQKLAERTGAMGSSFDISSWETHFQLSNLRDVIVPLWPGYRKTLNRIQQNNIDFARACLELTGKQVLADTQKDPSRIKFLRETEGLDLRVIHLVRDVRAGTASIMKNHKIGDPARAARQWMVSNRNADRACRYVSPDRRLSIRYEDLCANTQGVMDQVSDFLRLDRAPVPSDIFASEHHVIGNRMRLEKTGTVRQDDSWQQRLSSSDLELIAWVAGKANRLFGFNWP